MDRHGVRKPLKSDEHLLSTAFSGPSWRIRICKLVLHPWLLGNSGSALLSAFAHLTPTAVGNDQFAGLPCTAGATLGSTSALVGIAELPLISLLSN